jgi:hypothetical protein
MTEAKWLKCREPSPMFDFIESSASIRRCRLLACALCRRIWDQLTDYRSQRVVQIVEGVVDGLVNELQIPTAWDDARAAAGPQSIGGMTGIGDIVPPNSEARSAAAYTATTMPQGLLTVLVSSARASENPKTELMEQCKLFRDIFGNPFRPVSFDSNWRTTTAIQLARQMYDSRDFSAMPILADALQDAGCDNADILDHCRGPGPHVRGCWVMDLVMGKE